MVQLIPYDVIEEALKNDFIDCKHIHDGTCLMDNMKRWARTLKSVSGYYIPFHVIPLLLFKRKQLRKNPVATLKHALVGYIKSLIFMASYVSTVTLTVCILRNLFKTLHPAVQMTAGATAAFQILWEAPSRRDEITLFIFPRFLEVVWNFLKKRKYVKDVQAGQNMMFALAMSAIVYFFHKQPDSLKKSYFSIFKQVLGEKN